MYPCDNCTETIKGLVNVNCRDICEKYLDFEKNPCNKMCWFPSCDEGCKPLEEFKAWRAGKKKVIYSEDVIENLKQKLEEYATEIIELKETNRILEEVNKDYKRMLFGGN